MINSCASRSVNFATYFPLFFSGAPGAGKTSLLRELVKEWRPNQSIFCRTPPTDENVDDLWVELASKVTGVSEDDIRASSSEARTLSGGLNMGARAEASETRTIAFAQVNIRSCHGIKKRVGNGKAEPVIVCIDEIQDVKNDSKLGEFIRDLHTQESLPILLVCAGLANGQIVLRMVLTVVAVSRPDPRHVRPIGRLTSEETLEVTKKSLAVIANEVNISEQLLIQRYANDIARASDCWPKHLTSHLQGLCEALIAHDGPDLSTLTIQDVLAYGNRLRGMCYRDRLKSSKIPLQDVLTLYDQARRGIDEDGCVELLQTCLDKSERRKFKNTFRDGEEVFNAALRSGILMFGEDDQSEIPIPSMETFVRDKARNRQAQAVAPSAAASS